MHCKEFFVEESFFEFTRGAGVRVDAEWDGMVKDDCGGDVLLSLLNL